MSADDLHPTFDIGTYSPSKVKLYTSPYSFHESTLPRTASRLNNGVATMTAKPTQETIVAVKEGFEPSPNKEEKEESKAPKAIKIVMIIVAIVLVGLIIYKLYTKYGRRLLGGGVTTDDGIFPDTPYEM